LIGIFSREFEHSEAQENKTKKKLFTARAGFKIQKIVRRPNVPDGHCDGGTTTVSAYNVTQGCL